MVFKKGQVANPTGRPVGASNKVNYDIKTMLSKALQEVGGIEYLKQQAHENPVAFMGLISKIIPNEIRLEIKNPLMRMELEDVARLIDAIGRKRGIAVPSSVRCLSGPEIENLPPVQKTD